MVDWAIEHLGVEVINFSFYFNLKVDILFAISSLIILSWFKNFLPIKSYKILATFYFFPMLFTFNKFLDFKVILCTWHEFSSFFSFRIHNRFAIVHNLYSKNQICYCMYNFLQILMGQRIRGLLKASSIQHKNPHSEYISI